MMTFSMYVLWLFIQSERFGDFLSRNITKYTEAKYKINLSFENARVEFFPPGLLLNNVVADTQDYNLNISQLGVYFSVIDLFSNRVSIQDIILKDGVVDIYNLVNKNSEENTENKFKKIKK